MNNVQIIKNEILLKPIYDNNGITSIFRGEAIVDGKKFKVYLAKLHYSNEYFGTLVEIKDKG